MSNEADSKARAGTISESDADKIVEAVLTYAMNSDKEIPLSQEALVGFTDGLIQSVITVRNCS